MGTQSVRPGVENTQGPRLFERLFYLIDSWLKPVGPNRPHAGIPPQRGVVIPLRS